MRLPKTLLYGTIALFGLIGVTSIFKDKKQDDKISESSEPIVENTVQEILLDEKKEEIALESTEVVSDQNLPEVDRINKLFAFDSSKLPIVETITYSSRVPWLKGRPAWIADYASHYETSRHFIARSLNKKPDYITQNVNLGDKFNVFKKDQNISFYLLIDLSKAKMWFYALDNDTRYLLKTYKVGLGRKDSSRSSGFLTPKGKFALGSKIAIYKPGTVGYFQDRKIEMIRVFGTRWIPFNEELSENCTENAKGFGIHGAPWITDSSTGQLLEDRSKIGKYESDGCIRLLSEDVEELFSIIITKPTIVELVDNYFDAKLPGVEEK